MRINYIISNINWDTDGEPVDDLPDEVLMPHTVACELCGLPESASTEEVLDELLENCADILSDRYGFCVFSADVRTEPVKE